MGVGKGGNKGRGSDKKIASRAFVYRSIEKCGGSGEVWCGSGGSLLWMHEGGLVWCGQ